MNQPQVEVRTRASIFQMYNVLSAMSQSSGQPSMVTETRLHPTGLQGTVEAIDYSHRSI